MFKNKLKGLLLLKGLKVNDLKDKLQIQQPSMSAKLRNTSFNLSDLVKIAELTNTTFCLIDNETGKIIFEIKEEDIK